MTLCEKNKLKFFATNNKLSIEDCMKLNATLALIIEKQSLNVIMYIKIL